MNFASFDLNLLRVLDALLHEGTTAAAGAKIGLSQPAVSSALGRLRHALGDPLFVRRGQGMEPTIFAETLKDPLRRHLDDLSSLLSAGGPFDPMTTTDSFRLSGSDYFAEMLMPQLAANLSQRAPGMRVQIVDLVPDNYVDTLQKYEVDIAMIPGSGFPGWVDSQSLLWASFAVLAQKGNKRLLRHGLSPGDVIPIDLYCDMGHVLFSPDGSYRGMSDRALSRLGRERRVVMTMPYFIGVARVVSQSDLITLLPRELGERLSTFLPLEIFEAPMPLPRTEVRMVWHQRQSARASHRWLRGQIAEVLAPYSGQSE